MTHDTHVADWLGRSGASVKTGRFQCVIHFLSLEAAVIHHYKFQCVPECLRPWFLQHLTGLSHIYYTSKAKWTYDIISKTRKSFSL